MNYWFADVDVLKVDLSQSLPCTTSTSGSTVYTTTSCDPTSSKSFTNDQTRKKGTNKILSSIGRTTNKSKEKSKDKEKKAGSGNDEKEENEDGCSGCPQLPSLDDLRYYAYEGDGSTPGSLSSCCSGVFLTLSPTRWGKICPN